MVRKCDEDTKDKYKQIHNEDVHAVDCDAVISGYDDGV